MTRHAMKPIAILGSTGSVGVTTLDVVSRFPERFRVVAMAAGRNLDLLADQVRRFPAGTGVGRDARARARIWRPASTRAQVDNSHGIEGAIAVATHPDAKLVMSALVGALGLRPTLAAIKAGKDIAFANKEVLVIAGELMTRAVREHGVRLLPVDSEHNAIFQCLEGRLRANLKRIILTASGGPFREWPNRPLRGDHHHRRAQPSDLADGQQDHHRLGHPDEQGTGSDRGALAVRSAGPTKSRVVIHPQSVDSFDGRDDRRLGDCRNGGA